MFAEAIPGVVIQLWALLSADGRASVAALVSLVTSALTTGFISATMSYDWDTDAKQRKQTPDFYGYAPDNTRKRAAVFFSLMVFSSSMLLAKASVLIMLGLVRRGLPVVYVCLDLGLYLFVKIVRNDFYYWLPLSGVVEFIASVLARVIVKLVADFTCIVQFRHPNEIGGIYWLVSLLLSLLSLPLVVQYHRNIMDADNETNKSFLDLAQKACYALPLCSIASLSVFFLSINKEYRKTFFSTERGKDFTVRKFLTSNEDAVKADAVFCNTQRHWNTIEDVVHKWVRNNWEKWKLEQPAWFQDEGIRGNIPSHMIPNEKDREKVEDLQHERRRSSFIGRVSGTRRSSSVGAEKVTPE